MELSLPFSFLLILFLSSSLPLQTHAQDCPVDLDFPEPVPSHFYPFGFPLDYAQTREQGLSGRLDIVADFTFYHQRFQQIWLDNNGALSFLQPVLDYSQDAFPINGTIEPGELGEAEEEGFFRNYVMIAPFWSDINPMLNNGTLYYRQALDPTTLCNVTAFIRRQNAVYKFFNATWALIVTWHNVTYDGGDFETNVNTFQAVLTTDGRDSFVMFNYGEMSWTSGTAAGSDSSGNGGVGGEAGFNAGDGVRFYRLPGSRTAALLTLDSQPGNTGVVGRWLFRVSGESIRAEICGVGSFLRILPGYGLAYGGKRICVSGPCFSESSEVICRSFSNGAYIQTPGQVVSPHVASCLTPALNSTGWFPLEVSMDGGTTYTYNGDFLSVADEPDYMVTLLDLERWYNLPFTNLRIAWPDYTIDDSMVRVEFVDFSGGNQGLVIRLLFSTPNNGSATLPETLPFAEGSSLNGTIPLFGAIRVSGFSTGAEGQYLWSDPIPAFWLAARYLLEIYIYGANGTPLPNAGSLIYSFLLDEVDSYSELVEMVQSLDLFRLLNIFQAFLHVRCDEVLANEMENPTDFSVLPIPPCTSQQASLDPNWQVHLNCEEENIFCRIFYRDSAICFRPVQPVDGHGLVACYNSDGQLLEETNSHVTIGYPGAGNSCYYRKDVVPFLSCCIASNNCDEFLRGRPFVTCQGFEPRGPGWTGGDPHFVTWDNRHYTFNGLGEYWLVQGDFNVQIRTNHFLGSGTTVVTSVVAWVVGISERVQFELSPIPNEITVRVDGVVQTTADLLAFSPRRQLSINVNNHEATMVFLRAGAALNCRAESIRARRVADSLSIAFHIPMCYMGQTRGLNGNFDGDETNDFWPRGALSPISDGSDGSTIFTMFGETWRVSAAESQFSYPIGESYGSNLDPAFVPIFPTLAELMTPAAMVACGMNPACLLDFHASTGDAAFISNTMAEIQNALMNHQLFMDAREPCFSRPCGDRGVCTPSGPTFSCACLAGFTGIRCETAVTVCTSNPCQNNGRCSLSNTDPRGYECACPAGFSGDNCENAVTNDPCSTSNPCLNGGTCFYATGRFMCVCRDGYHGDRCQNVLNPGNDCRTIPCENGGLCIYVTLGQYECHCPPGYAGSRCQFSNPCLSTANRCLNGGTCTVDDQGRALCLCAPGYVGTNCQTSDGRRSLIIGASIGGILFVLLLILLILWCWRRLLQPRIVPPTFTPPPPKMIPFNPNFRRPPIQMIYQ